MTHPIIKTDNYLLVVDESEIKDTNWMYYKHFGEDVVCKYDRMNGKNTNVNEHKPFYQKIIFHLPLNNAPTLEGVPLLPPLEDESNFFAEQETIKNEWNSEKSFKAGYNKAKEKYKYTEEDLREALSESFKASQEGYNITCDEIIQSLQQTKYPVAFEYEMEYKDMVGYWYKVDEITKEAVNRFDLETRPKTITNSQGLIQVVGKYIY
jgi:hypothetical protein